MKKMVILVSGGGTNLQRIIDCIGTGEIPNAEIALVVADRECFGLQRAEKHGIKNVIIKRGKDFSEKLADVLPENTDLIVLAGFLSILNKEFCERFPGKSSISILLYFRNSAAKVCGDIMYMKRF